MKAVLAGGSGFLGASLADELVARGWSVVILTRRPRQSSPVREVAWDGATIGPWTAELEDAQALVNFTGRSVNCVHTPENKRAILESRVASVRVLGEALARCRKPPLVWLQCGSLAIYGNPGDRVCDETAPTADDFSAQVCRQWEAAFAAAATTATRQVFVRIGLVLGPGGGALGPLERLTRWFLGGTVGSGRQYLSWLHQHDMNVLFLAALTDQRLSGAYNACSPNPVTNAEFMHELRRALHRPWSPPAPEWVVRFGARFLLRTDADLALTGRRCVPARLQAHGFEFKFPLLADALRDIYRR
jgi:uncharacterized protein (TIGR01777 family)